MEHVKKRDDSIQSISMKESPIFCLFSGIFIYAVCSIPCLHLYLFPPQNSGLVDFVITCIHPPDKFPLMISFGFFAIMGIWFLKKADIQNRIVHFSVLALILAIGGGFLTGIVEMIYYVFVIGNESSREIFFAELSETYYGFQYSIKWALAFTIIQIPFTGLYLSTTALITKFNKRNKFH